MLFVFVPEGALSICKHELISGFFFPEKDASELDKGWSPSQKPQREESKLEIKGS